jgi:hypothetical protein
MGRASRVFPMPFRRRINDGEGADDEALTPQPAWRVAKKPHIEAAIREAIVAMIRTPLNGLISVQP